LPFDHKNAKQEFTFILPAAKLRECIRDRDLEENLENWLAADDNWCNGIIDYLAPLQSGGYAILDFKTHWDPAAQHSVATQKRIEKQLQLYAVAAKQLGFDVRKLYAMRIYGISGEITLEEIDL
jgi:ATP-dependent exoDNAse (exonuclease V) beta subunit